MNSPSALGHPLAVRLALATLLVSPPALSGQAVIDLDRSGDHYPVVRIPALAVTTVGTIIAAYDGRPRGADLPAPIVLVVRRSSDGGATWGPRQVARSDTAPLGFGDPSLLVDRHTGRIFLFYAASVNQGFLGAGTGNADDDADILHADLSWSDDDGLSWQHRRLTSAIKPVGWGGLFASSGQGIQLTQGPHAGRLVQQYTVRIRGGNYAVSLLSDDHGKNWRFGTPVGPGLDENKSAQLADGSLMLSSRASPYRLVSRSVDGGETWSAPVADSQLPDPANNGALVRVDEQATADEPRAHQLLFVNTADTTQRRALTLRLSCDDGRTWPVARTLVAGPAGYSTIAVLPGGDIGLLFERGNYAAISFVRLPMTWLGACH